MFFGHQTFPVWTGLYTKKAENLKKKKKKNISNNFYMRGLG